MLHRLRSHPSWVPVAVAVAVALGVAGCSGSETDPAQARQDRVEKRLRESFSATQARCIVDHVDPAVVRALDRSVDLDADASVMRSYSDAVTACVTDPEAPTTSTSSTTAGS